MDILSALASILFVPALLVTACYLFTCVFWPFKACRVCRGHGQFYGLFRGIRLCGACDGTGLRLRFGRRLINAAGRLYRELNAANRNHRNR
ncbi:hypothetical protein [Actinocrispum wychmicini]|uniref:Uncharacterized protein n=1 Tax=Actinocrispum wychmicini TaxID=1213861 RepID=A0A4R2ITU2_9PSEU|nr:hypothetical protein [Actinocrispum wychmicini]TCO47982.1 hypothetical protein EV192_11635 [Actinocrispum wychmicini]